MQSILTIRPDQLRTGAENIESETTRVKANSIESPPKSESPQKYDDYQGDNGENMEEDKAQQIGQRTSVITENRPVKVKSLDYVKTHVGNGTSKYVDMQI